jgi:bifunctional non-homologous end joining protein LigD
LTCGILCAVPSFTPPMLATSGRPNVSLDGWVVEPKADGWRAQVAVDADGCTVWTRTGRDITAKVPEVAVLADLGVEVVLDGELVTGAGLPADFYPLAGLMSARRRRRRVTFVAFDVLRLNGRSLLDYDLASRREVLDCLVRMSDGA